ncbi:mediator of RNA polymerase II transcription subunit 24 isoform X2 [Oncorhynchus mykiss]|uniref:mediator of RNA polymerase II transcription subunit 24 isoform X2 n=1 Tax=Oncorhynchus mykiss TaxID=8022 RepID=UPI001878A87A|nr:mediator of RNA polymerase II transcription subunit 24 isoform X2 [Oncorhynchus mykiss]XP_036802348.1 mediator of RNA polymerase II transcription subunit 24 isoform X2 [Oncorhynchus mykiss]
MVVWLLTGCAWYCERLGELGPAAVTEASHRACQERLRDLVNSTKNRALVHIACLENQASWTNVELAFFKVTEGLSSLTNQTERQAGNVYFIGEEYSYDRVGTVRPPASLIVPLGPRLHHAGRNHEPDGGDSATGGTADDDQEGAGAAEGDLPGVGQPGGAAALQHFLPGHPADHLHPAGPHPAHRLCLMAQPGRPAQQGPGQVTAPCPPPYRPPSSTRST